MKKPLIAWIEGNKIEVEGTGDRWAQSDSQGNGETNVITCSSVKQRVYNLGNTGMSDANG